MGPNYSFEYVYDTYEDADDARNCLFKEVGRYEFLSLNDVNDILDKDAPFMDPEVGWTEELIMESRVEKRPLGYFLWLPKPININIIEEDKNMANRNATTKTPVHLYNYEDSPEDVEFEKKRKELMDEAEKKILDIRKELAVALDKLDEERFEQEMQRRDAMQAKAWKRKYDALIAEGFTIEQAWEMTMKWFEAD